MSAQIEEYRQRAEQARGLYRVGKITREEAKEQIAPYATAFNEKSLELARKYNQKHKPFSLASYLR